MAFTFAFVVAALAVYAQAQSYPSGGLPVPPVGGHGPYDPRQGQVGYPPNQGGPYVPNVPLPGGTYRGQLQGVLGGIGNRGGCLINGCPLGYTCVDQGIRTPYCELNSRVGGPIGGTNGGPIGGAGHLAGRCYSLQFPTGCQTSQPFDSVLRCVYVNGRCERYQLSKSCAPRGEYNNIFNTCIECESICGAGVGLPTLPKY